MLEYGWVGPVSWGYHGLQAHEVFQDLNEIYQSSPAATWTIFPISMKQKPPSWDSPIKRNWVIFLKTKVNFYKEEKNKNKANSVCSDFHTLKANLCLWFEGLYLVGKGKGIS